MTLLEVMVALAVAGAALAGGAAVLGFLVDQQTRTDASALIAAQSVRSNIRMWVSHAMLTTEGDAEFRGAPEQAEMMSMRRDTSSGDLSLVTAAATDIAPAGSQVHFHLQRTGSERGLVAELTPFRNRAAVKTIMLVPNASAFRVRYLGSIFGRPMWQDSWISTSVLPAAIEIRITLDSAQHNPDQALLAVPLLIPLAARR